MIRDEFFSTSFEISGIHFSVIAQQEGLSFLMLNQPLKHKDLLPMLSPNAVQFFGVYDQLLEYFAGARKEFDVPLCPEGTDFQLKVWRQLTKIPYGKTSNYKEVAKKIKNPLAVRAVGTANGANPIPIIVPCHRVINSNGALGGYSAGISIKKQLLELEKKYL